MGVKNTLVDSVSRLLDITPEAKPTQEPPDEEFGVACFEVFVEQIENIEIEVAKEVMQEVKIPIPKEQMLKLQKNDQYCRQIVRQI